MAEQIERLVNFLQRDEASETAALEEEVLAESIASRDKHDKEDVDDDDKIVEI